MAPLLHNPAGRNPRHLSRITLLVVLLVLGTGLPAQTAFAVVDAGGGGAGLSGDNAPPEAAFDEISTAKGTPGDTNVLVNDVDPDGDPLTIESWTHGGTCTGLEKVGVPVKQGKKAVETATSFNSFG